MAWEVGGYHGVTAARRWRCGIAGRSRLSARSRDAPRSRSYPPIDEVLDQKLGIVVALLRTLGERAGARQELGHGGTAQARSAEGDGMGTGVRSTKTGDVAVVEPAGEWSGRGAYCCLVLVVVWVVNEGLVTCAEEPRELLRSGSMRRISIETDELARRLGTLGLDETSAQDFARKMLGRDGPWKSALVNYRMTSDFQADWLTEVGRWLFFMSQLGVLEAVLGPVGRKFRTNEGNPAKPHPNDEAHKKLQEQLYQAMAAYWLQGTGWTVSGYEPSSPTGCDVDIRVVNSDGTEFNVQVKAPDTPGEIVDYQVVNGERDEVVTRRVLQAAEQLPRNEAGLVMVSAKRRFSLAEHFRFLDAPLIGASTQYEDRCVIHPQNLGRLFSGAWEHVSAVVLLDLLRAFPTRYVSTVLLNPRGIVPCSPEHFPHARVGSFGSGKVVWSPSDPQTTSLPSGTIIESPRP